MSHRLLFASLFASLLAGCALVIDLGEQPALYRAGDGGSGECEAADCATLVSDAGADASDASADPLACLGSRSYVPLDTSRQLPLVQQFVQQLNQLPIRPGQATIKLCARSDLACASPRAILDTDEQGFIRTEVEYGFSGYLDFTSPGLQSSLYVISPVVSENRRVLPLQALNPESAQYLVQAAFGNEVQLEPTLAGVIMAVVDCHGERLAGVSFQSAVTDSQDRTRVFYILNPGVPTSLGTETNRQGQAGFFNLPPGLGTITGTFNAQQRRIVRMDMPLRAGYFTYGLMEPEDYQ